MVRALGQPLQADWIPGAQCASTPPGIFRDQGSDQPFKAARENRRPFPEEFPMPAKSLVFSEKPVGPAKSVSNRAGYNPLREGDVFARGFPGRRMDCPS